MQIELSADSGGGGGGGGGDDDDNVVLLCYQLLIRVHANGLHSSPQRQSTLR